MVFINLMSSASAKTGCGGGNSCSRGLRIRGRYVGLISVNSVRGRCKSDVILLPWCRFFYRAGTFLVSNVCMRFSYGIVLGVGSVCKGDCLLGRVSTSWGFVWTKIRPSLGPSVSEVLWL